jgi:hypothetical protein
MNPARGLALRHIDPRHPAYRANGGGHSTERSLRRSDFVLLGGMAALEKCYEIRLDWLPRIAMEGAYGGLLEEIRQDPRFTALMEKLDIPSAPDA